MTEATVSHSAPLLEESLPKIHYQVAMPQPATHLFKVTLHIQNVSSPILDLKLPVWTPGSYLVREYAKYLQDFTVASVNQPLSWSKISKNHWQVSTENVAEVTVEYSIFANELSVRTNHLDSSHGYFNGAALFLRVIDEEKQPMQVTIIPPNDQWQITTALPTIPGKSHTFLAANFDTLVDSPFEIGTHQLHHFQVMGKPHELAIWGEGNFQVKQMIADITKIIQVEAKMFAGLPYDKYLFILHLFSQAYGGLEHKNSCSLIYQRFGFRDRQKYERFMQLVAHEFFHLWNVKRIRPQELSVFDYDQENYTPCLWFCEGTTSYYDLLIPFRAGIYDTQSFLQNWSKEITRFLNTPGRKVQPLTESSFDAWIKLYRPHAHSPNYQISYYLKGEMISLLLDLLIRSQHQNQRSLDDVMVQMWEQFGKSEVGYTSAQLKEVIESVAGKDLTDFYQKYITGTQELPFNEYLEPFGLQLVADTEKVPFFGIRVSRESGREVIKFVEVDSPAHSAGIDAGDELLAIDGLRVSENQLSDRLQDYQPQDTIQVTFFHHDQLCSVPVTLDKPHPHKYQVVPITNHSEIQKQNFSAWLGTSLTDIALDASN
ncbi:M61 family metallopeptidase [Calothrix rhizosoleniae]|uniref:M61 family metallopeptidase n=1 Tax=Calothrix rhizosoleniae TaxID=888997 RepID=UPI00190EEAEA|nr:M61 family metallopeptidase [Calothrix rhizosoleniae]